MITGISVLHFEYTEGHLLSERLESVDEQRLEHAIEATTPVVASQPARPVFG